MNAVSKRDRQADFEFGVQGWTWGDPVPKSITFFLDNTAAVCDQYGRHVRKAVLDSGAEVVFAGSPPDASKEGTIVPRPHLATHAQVIAALRAEGINWMAYEVRHLTVNGPKLKGNLTLEQAQELQIKMIKEGAKQVSMERSVACAGWPQLPYEELKKLPEVPPTPIEELQKIKDPKLRKDALKFRAEATAAVEMELQEAAAEE